MELVPASDNVFSLAAWLRSLILSCFFFLWNLYYILKNDCKVEKILKSSLDSIPSPSSSVKIQIMGVKVCLRCKSKTLLGIVNKLFIFKSLLTTPSNVLPLYLKQTFPPIILIFNEGEGDVVEFISPFKIFPTSCYKTNIDEILWHSGMPLSIFFWPFSRAN